MSLPKRVCLRIKKTFGEHRRKKFQNVTDSEHVDSSPILRFFFFLSTCARSKKIASPDFRLLAVARNVVGKYIPDDENATAIDKFASSRDDDAADRLVFAAKKRAERNSEGKRARRIVNWFTLRTSGENAVFVRERNATDAYNASYIAAIWRRNVADDENYIGVSRALAGGFAAGGFVE